MRSLRPRSRAGGLLARVFGVDLRSLAAFRIAAGGIALFDLATRLPLLPEFYSDAGVLPRALVPFGADRAPFAFHMWGGSLVFQAALFAIGFAGAFGMLIGWHTRLCTAITYLHQLSLFWRNPLVLNGGDFLLVWLLFWCPFLPLGARFSLDAQRRGRPEPVGEAFSFASAGLLVQLASLYFFSVFHKLAGEGWLEGSMVSVAVSHEAWGLPLGRFLAEFPAVLRVLTWAVLATEGVGSLLLLSPFATARCRLVGIAGFAALQLGLGLSIELWLFPWVATAGLLPFVPGAAWDALRGRVARGGAPDVGPGRLAWWVAWIPALALGYILFSHVERLQEWLPPRWLSRGGRFLGLNQGPSMYSTQRLYDVELHLIGEFEDGRRRTLDDGRASRWPELDALRSAYRGRLYLEQLAEQPRERPHRGLAQWTCARWNAESSPRLRSVSLVRVRRSLAQGGAPARPVRRELLSARCPQVEPEA